MYFKYVFQLLVFQLLHNTDDIIGLHINTYQSQQSVSQTHMQLILWT